MSYELTFKQTSATTAHLTLTYPVGDSETGSEHFTYHAAKPADVVKETRVVVTAGGQRVQLGIQLRNGSGHGVAWKV